MIASTVKSLNNPLEIINDPLLLKRAHLSRYEYVDVVFGPADSDVTIPHTQLRPENPELVRWQDVTPNTVNVGGTDTPTFVYRATGVGKVAFGQNYIVLRATQANYATRLLLFMERI